MGKVLSFFFCRYDPWKKRTEPKTTEASTAYEPDGKPSFFIYLITYRVLIKFRPSEGVGMRLARLMRGWPLFDFLSYAIVLTLWCRLVVRVSVVWMKNNSKHKMEFVSFKIRSDDSSKPARSIGHAGCRKAWYMWRKPDFLMDCGGSLPFFAVRADG